MTHRCLNCYDPIYMYEDVTDPDTNSTDGLFCLKCSSTLSLRGAFYEIIKALDKKSKTFLEFENGQDYAEIRFEEKGTILAVSYDKRDKDYTIYIKFKGHTIFLIGRKTITEKTVFNILNDHAPVFGNRYFE